jgi:hypothetical protein
MQSYSKVSSPSNSLRATNAFWMLLSSFTSSVKVRQAQLTACVVILKVQSGMQSRCKVRRNYHSYRSREGEMQNESCLDCGSNSLNAA